MGITVDKQYIPEDAIEICAFQEPFNWENTTNIIVLLNNKIEEFNFSVKVKRKVINIITECLDNVCKHRLNNNPSDFSTFVCKYKNGNLYVSIGNLVSKDTISSLSNSIETLNTLDKEQLKEMYKNQLKNGKMGEKDNAGVGLLEISRKTSEKLRFDFNPVSDLSAYFTLFVVINVSNEDN